MLLLQPKELQVQLQHKDEVRGKAFLREHMY
jgi:hypothetical protein